MFNQLRIRRSFVLLAAMLLSVGACTVSESADSTTSENTTETPTATEAAPTTQAADSVALASLEVANNYMLALAAHDGAAVSMMFAEGANIDDFFTTPDEIIADHEFQAATGQDYLQPTCTEPDLAAPNTVFCTYLMQNDWGRSLGVGPFDGSKFTFAIENGEITGLTHFFDLSEFSDQVWRPTRRWVAINYPDDLAVMYDDIEGIQSGQRISLDPASIELWRQHTEEFVALGGANLDQ